jgi:hypothetical protein
VIKTYVITKTLHTALNAFAGGIVSIKQNGSYRRAAFPELSRHLNGHQPTERQADQAVRMFMACTFDLLDVMSGDLLYPQEYRTVWRDAKRLKSIQRLILSEFQGQSPKKNNFAASSADAKYR